MSIRIVDLFIDIDHCFINNVFSKEKWDDYILMHLPYAKTVIEEDIEKYNYEAQILPVLNNMYIDTDRLQIMHNLFLSVVKDIEQKIQLKLPETSIDAIIVFFLGLCNGAGWAISINNTPHVFLGIEKIIELNWDNRTDIMGLIYHELGHLWHFQNRTTELPVLATSKDEALWQLYTEGVAMNFEQLLCEDDLFYHQNKDGWLDWCIDNKSILFNEYIEVIERNESHQKFFGDWCNYLGVSDIGYYLGCELIRFANKSMTSLEILNLSLNDIESMLYAIKGSLNINLTNG